MGRLLKFPGKVDRVRVNGGSNFKFWVPKLVKNKNMNSIQIPEQIMNKII